MSINCETYSGETCAERHTYAYSSTRGKGDVLPRHGNEPSNQMQVVASWPTAPSIMSAAANWGLEAENSRREGALVCADGRGDAARARTN